MKKKAMLFKAIKESNNIKQDIYKSQITNNYKQYQIENKNIGIMNLSRGAGSTFITTNLAKAFVDNDISTAIIELPLEQPKIYINLGIEQKLCKDDENGYLKFYSYAHEIDANEKIEKDRETYIDDIILIVPDPNKENIKAENWNYNKMIKLLNVSRKANFNLIDINNSFNNECVYELVDNMDALLVIIDPNPTEVIININTLKVIQKLENEKKVNVKYIINKSNEGVNIEELRNFLDIEELTSIPYIETSLVYKSLYQGEILYKYEGANEILEKAFIPIYKEFLPESLIFNKAYQEEKETKKIFKFFQ